MKRPTEVHPRAGYRIWLRFTDGVAGEIDLSQLAGKGVFKVWDEPGYFEKVHIAILNGLKAWNVDRHCFSHRVVIPANAGIQS